MKKIILAAMIATTPLAAHASDGSMCMDVNIAVATEAANLQAFIKIQSFISHGVITAELLRYVDELIDADKKYIARMSVLGFPGYPVSSTKCDVFAPKADAGK